MVFTALTISGEQLNVIRDAAKKPVAIDYSVQVVWDGAIVYVALPTTTALLDQLQMTARPSNLRLKHVTIKSDDIVAGPGKVCVYASNTATASQAWGFTRNGGEWLGFDTDMLIEAAGRSYGTYGLMYVWFNTAPLNTTTSIIGVYFEVN